MIHIGNLIEEEVYRQHRSVTWLAARLFCDRSNVYPIFKRKSIDTDLLLRISIVLEHNFFKYYEDEFTPPLQALKRLIINAIWNNSCRSKISLAGYGDCLSLLLLTLRTCKP